MTQGSGSCAQEVPGCLLGSLVLVADVALVLASVSNARERSQGPLQVAHTQNPHTVALYQVFEPTFLPEGTYANPFLDATREEP